MKKVCDKCGSENIKKEKYPRTSAFKDTPDYTHTCNNCQTWCCVVSKDLFMGNNKGVQQ